MYKLFLIEDDPKIESLIKHHLEKYQYHVYTVKQFNDIEQEFNHISPDLVLLDINLPYFDGFYFCRLFRKKSNIPIMIISARSSDVEQVMGIELGADDYLIKPFSIDVLVAKVKALIRRYYGDYKQEILKLEHNGLLLDESTFKMSYQESTVELSKNEFKLMKKFIESPNVYITRETLLETLWDDMIFVDENTLTVNVTRVKNKLTELGLNQVIATKRGVGYKFEMVTLC